MESILSNTSLAERHANCIEAMSLNVNFDIPYAAAKYIVYHLEPVNGSYYTLDDIHRAMELYPEVFI